MAKLERDDFSKIHSGKITVQSGVICTVNTNKQKKVKSNLIQLSLLNWTHVNVRRSRV